MLKKLAGLAGVPFPERHLSEEEKAEAQARAARAAALEVVYRLAVRDLMERFATSDPGGLAREYLHRRGLDLSAIADLELGLYPKVADVDKAVLAAGYEAVPDHGVWRKFEGYIVFPWRDAYGHLLTLYGRWPGDPPDGRPKTLALPGEHSKASPLYFDRARRAHHTSLVLVEGVLDAAVAQASGLTEVVAYVAGSPSRDQLDTLARHRISAVTICGDPDTGGEKGPRSLIKNIDPSIRVYVAPRLPDDTDPDQFILTRGPDAWREHIKQAERGIVWLAKQVLATCSLDSDTVEMTLSANWQSWPSPPATTTLTCSSSTPARH